MFELQPLLPFLRLSDVVQLLRSCNSPVRRKIIDRTRIDLNLDELVDESAFNIVTVQSLLQLQCRSIKASKPVVSLDDLCMLFLRNCNRLVKIELACDRLSAVSRLAPHWPTFKCLGRDGTTTILSIADFPVLTHLTWLPEVAIPIAFSPNCPHALTYLRTGSHAFLSDCVLLLPSSGAWPDVGEPPSPFDGDDSSGEEASASTSPVASLYSPRSFEEYNSTLQTPSATGSGGSWLSALYTVPNCVIRISTMEDLTILHHSGILDGINRRRILAAKVPTVPMATTGTSSPSLVLSQPSSSSHQSSTLPRKGLCTAKRRRTAVVTAAHPAAMTTATVFSPSQLSSQRSSASPKARQLHQRQFGFLISPRRQAQLLKCIVIEIATCDGLVAGLAALIRMVIAGWYGVDNHQSSAGTDDAYTGSSSQGSDSSTTSDGHVRHLPLKLVVDRLLLPVKPRPQEIAFAEWILEMATPFQPAIRRSQPGLPLDCYTVSFNSIVHATRPRTHKLDFCLRTETVCRAITKVLHPELSLRFSLDRLAGLVGAAVSTTWFPDRTGLLFPTEAVLRRIALLCTPRRFTRCGGCDEPRGFCDWAASVTTAPPSNPEAVDASIRAATAMAATTTTVLTRATTFARNVFALPAATQTTAATDNIPRGDNNGEENAYPSGGPQASNG